MAATFWIEKLAAAPCPGLQDCTPERSWHVGYSETLHPEGIVKDCPTCHGTGALIPGLRRGCPSFCACKFKGHDALIYHPKLYCQGKGWIRLPAAEQMGVLVRAAKGEILMWHNGSKGWSVEYSCDVLINPDTGEVPLFDEETPEEALAHAICQAQFGDENG